MELRISILARSTARLYCLPGLEALARSRIEQLCQVLHILSVLRVVQAVYSVIPDEDLWFQQYLKTKLRDAFLKQHDLFQQNEFVELIGIEPKFAKSLFLLAIDISLESAKATCCKKEGNASGSPTACAAVSLSEEGPSFYMLALYHNSYEPLTNMKPY